MWTISQAAKVQSSAQPQRPTTQQRPEWRPNHQVNKIQRHDLSTKPEYGAPRDRQVNWGWNKRERYAPLNEWAMSLLPYQRASSEAQLTRFEEVEEEESPSFQHQQSTPRKPLLLLPAPPLSRSSISPPSKSLAPVPLHINKEQTQAIVSQLPFPRLLSAAKSNPVSLSSTISIIETFQSGSPLFMPDLTFPLSSMSTKRSFDEIGSFGFSNSDRYVPSVYERSVDGSYADSMVSTIVPSLCEWEFVGRRMYM
ncbi:hypothetical protein EJ08DRAFT_469289 [Tothia fuscella]|uniref:Uncharacterized protein n=1 Tax=Tothia fuscella TaxID=1048955 RepID=A0A9P4U2F6_9PEZI|nr:hypothetical protein EJ08DRAFT_469289 [Tothia fuscella]